MDDNWSEADSKYGRKVGYLTLTGYEATAYLDGYLGDDRYVGTEKHTDQPIIVHFNGERYVEVASE